MRYEIRECKELILGILSKKPFKYELHDFPSGCSMVDIWKDKNFYVIHIEHDSVGLSLVEEADFSNIPDERFFDLPVFLEKLTSVLCD